MLTTMVGPTAHWAQAHYAMVLLVWGRQTALGQDQMPVWPDPKTNSGQRLLHAWPSSR
ncbi:hypothetical protein F441_02114 [Phytophthora nicotianae CJ01A1]|uniref:Uncharacterized protein n=3 Tax=Phytophthora nicotianae TaxID=4792 RepID=W2HIQ5_PHYNI|nr:hypothetical protein L915_02047 [Phytophthora nicotianae]ETL48379.1 hypothetical protein L916_02019 [Phytophthora nicotianae]ETP24977.1 hypothetical protein F441_02114 [Phytophthora nicotianae CJ01A1]